MSEPVDIVRAVDLRPELLPPPVSRQRLDELSCEIDRIAALVADRSGDADDAIRAFNAMTGHDYEAFDFIEYYGRSNVEEFAREAARSACLPVAGITRDELVEIVRRVLVASPESDYYLRLLEANVPHPGVSGLIFHPPEDLQDASAEEIVDEALKYRPIALEHEARSASRLLLFGAGASGGEAVIVGACFDDVAVEGEAVDDGGVEGTSGGPRCRSWSRWGC
jgi:hypothetical protein